MAFGCRLKKRSRIALLKARFRSYAGTHHCCKCELARKDAHSLYGKIETQRSGADIERRDMIYDKGSRAHKW